MGTSGNMQGERKEASPAAKARPKLNGEKSMLLSDSCSLLSLHFNLRHLPLETVPIEGGIRFHSWTIIRQCNQCVALQRDRLKISCIRLPIDVDLPTSWIRQLTGIVQLREPFSPDVQEVPERDGKTIGSLNVDHPIAGVRVEPVKARAVGRNTDLCRDGRRFPIDIDGHVSVNVKVTVFTAITRYSVYGGVGSVGRCLTLCNNEIDEAGNKQYSRRYNAGGRDALSASSTSPLFFTPKLFLPAPFLPRTLTSYLLAHRFHSPFKRALQDRCLQSSAQESPALLGMGRNGRSFFILGRGHWDSGPFTENTLLTFPVKNSIFVL